MATWARAPTDEAADVDAAVNDWGGLLQSLQLELELQGMTRNHLIAQTLRRLARMGWLPSSDEMRAAMGGAVVRAAAPMVQLNTTVRCNKMSFCCNGMSSCCSGMSFYCNRMSF